MHWAYKIAEELIEKHPNREVFICASGISPSGSVHIGNFREVVTTFFVVKALQSMGKQVRFIISWDDFDRFRKVPSNIDPDYEKYIGMPYSNIPDPYGCHGSYADHFEKEFESSALRFGVDAEFIYQNKEYKSRRYNKNILHALKKRKDIYNILMDFKTSTLIESDRNAFYPINLYCDACGKDHTEIIHFNEENGTLEYGCSCGHHDIQSVMEARNIKLNWKIDWPMRWMVEGVVFEPGGRDHSSETGSYNVSKRIAREIFNYPAPDYVAYDFIGIKGSHVKMSSSAGNSITPHELLKVYFPEIILFMFAKYHPNAAFNIGLDEDVIRHYTEYERLKAGHPSEPSIELSEIGDRQVTFPNFSQVAAILPLVNFDVQLLEEVLGEINGLEEVSSRAEYWIKNYVPQKMIHVNNGRDIESYEMLGEIQKKWIADLCDIIRGSSDLDNEQLMRKIYDICHDDDPKVKRANQKQLFKTVYKLVLNSGSGPRLPLLIKAVGPDKMLSLLDFS